MWGKVGFWNVLLRSLSLSAILPSSLLISDPAAAERWLTKYTPPNSHPVHDPGSCRRWGVNEVYTVQWVGLRSAPVSLPVPPPSSWPFKRPCWSSRPNGEGDDSHFWPSLRYRISPGNYTWAGLACLQSYFQGCAGKKRKKKVAHKLAEALKQMVADSLGRNQAATDMINEFTELRGEN